METLSLRLRVFLFFCLIAAGTLAALAAGLFLGYRQLSDPQALSAFVTAGIITAFGGVGISLAVWLLFDENVSKPVEALASGMRLRNDASVSATPARYLGDLAPAASAMQARLRALQDATDREVAAQTARLRMQREQLLRILSDIPIAVIIARSDHQIILYDGQAADLMERECPARLNGSVFDYLEKKSICAALDALKNGPGMRQEISVKGHSGAIFKGHLRLFGRNEGYTLMLEPLAPDAARPLVYDFDLLGKILDDDARGGPADDMPLRDLTYVVFDCETTGLDPDRDEVVQIGAVRVVNGKVIEEEHFDRLVHPGIPIPANSTRVHHIDDAMVEQAPPFAQVCPAFHQFATRSVLIAHNAPFDMAFLRRAASTGDFTFDNPVLDTVHLSAIVFGGSEEHTLDALCTRLDVKIPQSLRHTGLGDAMATAHAFTAMLPVLEERGLGSFGALRREARKHSRLLKIED